MNPTALYIHIPYCRNICDYCSFTVTKGNRVPDQYINAIKLDFQQSIENLKEPLTLKTIYFGGGTPSLLTNEQIEDLICFFKTYTNIKETEITLEANPTSLLENKIKHWVDSGINRISMGIQSFSNDTLKYLTRTHSNYLSRKAIDLLKNSNVKSFNIDLMMGMKTQSIEEFADGLQYLLNQKPNHISIYELTIEENTPFHKNKEEQRDEDEIAEMLNIIEAETEKYGIHRYEISNFAQEGHQSKHNLIYWHNKPYIGIGCGAFSFMDGHRFSKEKNIDTYINNILNQKSAIDYTEKLEPENFARETLMLGLRLVVGLNINDFEEQTKYNVLKLLGEKFKYFSDLGFIELYQNRIRLTKKGMRVANSILSEII